MEDSIIDNETSDLEAAQGESKGEKKSFDCLASVH
jgi:hypothetical protein